MRLCRFRRTARAALAGAALLSLSACELVYRHLGGDFAGPPRDLAIIMDGPAGDLVRAAFDFPGGAVPVDHHIHVLASGTGLDALCGPVAGPAPRITARRFAWWNLFRRVQTEVLLSAAGIARMEDGDEQYARRLLALVEHYPGPGTFHLLALDAYYDGPGRGPDWQRTDLYVPNAYVVALRDCLNAKLAEKGITDRRFAAVGSVNPYREDAVQALRRLARSGVRFVKWLPNVMGIDPADRRIEPFYRAMNELGLVLISHTGHETALITPGDHPGVGDPQRLGNPRRLRRALDAGVTVIMAHGGRDDDDVETEGPRRGEAVANFELFLRMMAEPAYRGRLFGGLSAMTMAKTAHQLRRMAGDRGLGCRFVNGSDYPLPASAFLNPTRAMAGAGLAYLTAAERRALDAIYGYNPLLFDFVLKRTIRPAGGRRLPDAMFLSLDTVRGPTGRGCKG